MNSTKTGRSDTALLILTGLAVLALAVVAGAISFAHMSELAAAHDQTGWKAYAFPVSVDGLEIVASLYLVVQHRAHRPTGWMPWVTLIVGTTASLAANIAVGGHDIIGRSLAGWPALSMLISVKLLSSMFDPSPAPDAQKLVRDVPDVPDTPMIAPDTVPDSCMIVPDVPDVPDVHQTSGPAQDVFEREGTQPLGTPPRGRLIAIPGDRAAPVDLRAVADLIPAARSARAALTKRGRSFSRDALAQTLRAKGYGVSNARASLLIKIVRAEGEKGSR